MPLPSEKSFCGFESEQQTNPMRRHVAYSVCDGLGTEQNTEGGWKLRSNFKPFVYQLKFMKFRDKVGTPCIGAYLPRSLPDCLYMSCFFQKIIAIKSRSRWKTEQMWKFLPQFLGRTAPTFPRQIVIAIYCPSFGKVWLSSVCWYPSAGG